MAGFKAAFLNELNKLLSKKKMIAAAVLSIISVVVGQFAVIYIKNGFGLRVAGSSEFPLAVLSFFSYTILPLFTAMVAIDMFSGEFSSNTMKITLARPVSRFGVFSAKVLNIALFMLLNLVFIMLLSIMAGLIFNGSSASFTGFVRVVVSYLTTLLPVFVFSLFIVMLSNILRGSLSVFFLSVVAFLAFNFLGVFFSNYSSFFITSMFDWYTLWISDSPNIFKIMRQFLILCSCGIMFFAGGYYFFERRDL